MFEKESPINSDKYQYVVGIDFGTTFSGAGYMAFKSAASDEVYDIKERPRKNKYLKIPTVIRYSKNDPDIYYCGTQAIEIRPGTSGDYGPIIRLFKLLLYEDNEGAPSLPEGLELLKVISDYLEYLHELIILVMVVTLGGDEEMIENTTRYCLTVPAIWSNEAKTLMREAVIRAGIIKKDDHPDRLLLIGESEAAALYAEKVRYGIQIKSNETLMICDAGGGTIDIVTYKKVVEEDESSYKEITVPCGNTCGSTQLDYNFRNYVWRMINKEVGSLSEEAKEKLLGLYEEIFINEIKHSFIKDITVDGPGEPILLEVPYQLPDMVIIKNGFEMRKRELAISFEAIEDEVFKPVVHEILELISFQLTQLKRDGVKLDYLILVGGFGQSSYLAQKLETRFKKEVGKITAPLEGQLAVSRGAVYFGSDPYSITHRSMKITYGFGISAPFEEGVDREDFRVVDKANRVFCRYRFDPCVLKGQDISLKKGIKRVYYTFNSNVCNIKLYGYVGDTIPRYVSDNIDTIGKGEMAHKVADFAIELPDQLRDEKGRVVFNIEVFFGHMEIRINVDVPGKNEKRTFMAYYKNEGNLLFNRRRNSFMPPR